MKRKFVYIIVAIALSANVFSILLMIYYQRSILSEIVQLKKSIVANTLQSVNPSDFHNYILNISYYKDLWNNTLFNLGGMSIVLTVIVLLITITTGYFMNQSFDNKFSSEFDKLRKLSENSTKDLFEIIHCHIGAGVEGYWDIDDEFRRIVKAINTYENLQIYNKNDFIKLYNLDIYEMTKYLIISIIRDNLDKVYSYFGFINSLDARKDVIDSIEKTYMTKIEEHCHHSNSDYSIILKNELEEKFKKIIRELHLHVK